MKKQILPLLPLGLGLSLLFPACTNTGYDNNTTRGAAGGAVAGAVLGGIIGHQSGETGAGAALGAAAGAAAGGAYGHSKDKRTSNYQTRDSYGYTEDDYYNLLTTQERETLRSRAGGRQDVTLTSYLTDEERANLRRRATGRDEVGR
jgi:outer membrane lipoprotein SlyB